jgi:spore maturation protein CgeB
MIGQLWSGSTCENRKRALEELGCKIIGFDVSPYIYCKNRFFASMAHRLNIGPSVMALNHDLHALATRLPHDIDLIWVDKGQWLSPQVLLVLKQATGARIAHYTPDAQLVDNQSRQFNAGVPLYDVMFTTKPFEVDLYRRLGARHIFLVRQSYDASRLFPRELSAAEREAFGADVSFIGHCQPHYANHLKVASKSRARIRVWGPGWRRYSRIHPWVRGIFSGDGVWGEDYAKALNAASIGLCLLSKKIPETTTTRTFEIPGCGAFMLAERTPHHLELFRESVEAEFFSSGEELVEKICFYLEHPKIRLEIAAAGHQRCQSNGDSDVSRMRQILDLVDA